MPEADPNRNAYSIAISQVIEEVGRLKPERIQAESRALFGAQEKQQRAANLSQEERMSALFNGPGGPALALKQRLPGAAGGGAISARTAAATGSQQRPDYQAGTSSGVLKQVGGSVMSSPRDQPDSARSSGKPPAGSLSLRLAAMKLNATNNHEQLLKHRDHLDEVVRERQRQEEIKRASLANIAARKSQMQENHSKWLAGQTKSSEFAESADLANSKAMASSSMASFGQHHDPELFRSPRLDALDNVLKNPEFKGHLNLKMELLRQQGMHNATQIETHRNHLNEVSEARRQAEITAKRMSGQA